MIKLENITKKYGDVTVFENYDFAVSDGEKIAVMGGSGCGKTTLLNIISGLVKCNGTVKADERCAYMFQEPRLLPWLNVKENIAAVLDRDSRHLADKYIRLVGIEEFSNKYPHELSGGMAQRASYARFLAYAEATDASLLMLDEPFSALDEELSDKMLRILGDFSKDKILIIVTHNSDDAEALGANIITL